jgi:hypothetical protein
MKPMTSIDDLVAAGITPSQAVKLPRKAIQGKKVTRINRARALSKQSAASPPETSVIRIFATGTLHLRFENRHTLASQRICRKLLTLETASLIANKHLNPNRIRPCGTP